MINVYNFKEREIRDVSPKRNYFVKASRYPANTVNRRLSSATCKMHHLPGFGFCPPTITTKNFSIKVWLEKKDRKCRMDTKKELQTYSVKKARALIQWGCKMSCDTERCHCKNETMLFSHLCHCWCC